MYTIDFDKLPEYSKKDKYDITVDIKIPTDPRTALQITRWGIVNDNGDVFCKFFHAIPSTYPPYPTLTPAS